MGDEDKMEVPLPEGMTREEFEELFKRWQGHQESQYYKIGTCPKCHTEISFLLDIGSIPTSCEVRVTRDLGQAEYGDPDVCWDAPENHIGFECPSCGDIVVETEEEAIQIFTGGENDRQER